MRYVIRDKGWPFAREMAIAYRDGEQKYRVHGRFVRARDELRVDDMAGVEQIYIKEPVLSTGTTYELYRSGDLIAHINLVEANSLLEGFDVVVSGGERFQARGGMFGKEFSIAGPNGRAAHVHWHDKHGIEVETAAGQDDVMLLASVIAMSAMTENRARASQKR